jgi:hypothetical protein
MHHLYTDFYTGYDSVRRKVSYIFIEFGISIKLVRFIKMSSNETYQEALIGKHLPHTFPIQNGLKQGDALSPLLINFVFKQAFKKVQANKGALKLNMTYQVVVCASYVISWAKTHTVQRKHRSFISC